jgi:hypothetical protein
LLVLVPLSPTAPPPWLSSKIGGWIPTVAAAAAALVLLGMLLPNASVEVSSGLRENAPLATRRTKNKRELLVSLHCVVQVLLLCQIEFTANHRTQDRDCQ